MELSAGFVQTCDIAPEMSPAVGLDVAGPRRKTLDVTSTDAGEALSPSAATSTEDPAARVFSASVLVSGVRCLLAYIVFPWLLPALGLAGGAGPGIGLVVGVVAIGFNVASIRRFWASEHRWKWHVTVLNVAVIVLLTVLGVQDVSELLG